VWDAGIPNDAGGRWKKPLPRMGKRCGDRCRASRANSGTVLPGPSGEPGGADQKVSPLASLVVVVLVGGSAVTMATDRQRGMRSSKPGTRETKGQGCRGVLFGKCSRADACPSPSLFSEASSLSFTTICPPAAATTMTISRGNLHSRSDSVELHYV